MTRARDLAAFVSNADGDIKFDTDTLFIDSSANRVGIGTTTPSTTLHVSGGTSGDATLTIEADTDNNDEDDNPTIKFLQDGAATSAEIGLVGTSGQTFTNSDSNNLYLHAAGSQGIDFATGTALAMRINQNGDVSFNGSSGTANTVKGYGTVTISDDHGSNNGGGVAFHYTGNSGYAQIHTKNNNSIVLDADSTNVGNSTTIDFKIDNAEVMSIDDSAKVTINQSASTAQVGIKGLTHIHGNDMQALTVTSDSSAGFAGISFSDHISSGNGAGFSTQRGYIRNTHSNTGTSDLSGRAGGASFVIGTTEDINQLIFQHAMSDSSNGTNAGELLWSSSTNLTLFAGSDRRLKDNIVSIPEGEGKTKVLAMNPVSFNLKTDTAEVKTNNLGFIANELVDVVPEVVTGSVEDDEILAVNYAGLTPVLTAALKDALAEIESLKTEITNIKARLDALEA